MTKKKRVKPKKKPGTGRTPSGRKARRGTGPNRVRLLVGTKKGAFILTSDGKRKEWQINGPHFAGWEMYHLKGSPVDPNRIYASQTSGWFGQVIQRSDDGGKTWDTPGSGPGERMEMFGMPAGESNKFVYEGEVGTHK